MSEAAARDPATAAPGEVAGGLELADVAVALSGVSILRRITLRVGEREMVTLVGRNGAGKTTTLRAIIGLAAATGGTIRFLGRDLTRSPANRRAALGIGYMPEDRRLNPLFTVAENLLLPVWAQRRDDGARRLDEVYALIPEVREFRARRTLELSGGQQKLVALGRALMVGDRLLLLDEPFEGVAPALASRLTQVVAASRAAGRAILLAQSELGHAQAISDRVVTIERGEIVRAARS